VESEASGQIAYLKTVIKSTGDSIKYAEVPTEELPVDNLSQPKSQGAESGAPEGKIAEGALARVDTEAPDEK
jgi:hypothetical protein